MTPAEWGRQAELGKVHERLKELSDARLGYDKGPLISGRIDLAQNAVTVWWYGPPPAEAQAVVERARAEGIVANLLAAPFSREQLDVTSERLATAFGLPDIGLSMVGQNPDGSGFTLNFRSAGQAAAAVEALRRIAAALDRRVQPRPEDQPYVALHASPGTPSITIDPQPASPTPG